MSHGDLWRLLFYFYFYIIVFFLLLLGTMKQENVVTASGNIDMVIFWIDFLTFGSVPLITIICMKRETTEFDSNKQILGKANISWHLIDLLTAIV